MPDVSVVLSYRSVWWEESCFRNIYEHLLFPCSCIFIISQHTLFCANVIFQIQKSHKPVFAHDLFIQTSQVHRIADAEQVFANDEVHQFFNFRVIIIDICRAVSWCLIQFDDFLWFLSTNWSCSLSLIIKSKCLKNNLLFKKSLNLMVKLLFLN